MTAGIEVAPHRPAADEAQAQRGIRPRPSWQSTRVNGLRSGRGRTVASRCASLSAFKSSRKAEAKNPRGALSRSWKRRRTASGSYPIFMASKVTLEIPGCQDDF
jgi:hypothetical protein